ncbi:MAG TPA: hypothetical protein VHA75_01865, partial [Rugosimonospora sp.]|nr:hypothetical protein [Rugosimonospora sp.]
QLTVDLAKAGVTRLVIESREGRDHIDRRTIYTALQSLGVPPSLRYEHLRGHEEPLLWIPDAIAWAYGAGGDWRRRISSLLEGVTDVDGQP